MECRIKPLFFSLNFIKFLYSSFSIVFFFLNIFSSSSTSDLDFVYFSSGSNEKSAWMKEKMCDFLSNIAFRACFDNIIVVCEIFLVFFVYFRHFFLWMTNFFDLISYHVALLIFEIDLNRLFQFLFFFW